jgi:hypothetical protein
MKKPETLDEAKRAIGDLAQGKEAEVLLVIIEELVDLACSGGMPVRDHLHDYKKLKFYQGCIARIVMRRRSSNAVPSDSDGDFL